MNTTESEDGSVGPLREALTVCAAAGMSGILRVTGDPGGAIHIADGLVAAVETPGAPGPEVLLLRSHRVSESGWDEAFAAAAASGGRMSTELTRREMVGAGELEWLLRTALADAMFVLANGTVDEYRAEPGQVDFVLPLQPGAEPDSLLAETSRRIRVLAALPARNGRDRIVAATGAVQPGVRLGEGQDEILALADGRRTRQGPRLRPGLRRLRHDAPGGPDAAGRPAGRGLVPGRRRGRGADPPPGRRQRPDPGLRAATPSAGRVGAAAAPVGSRAGPGTAGAARPAAAARRPRSGSGRDDLTRHPTRRDKAPDEIGTGMITGGGLMTEDKLLAEMQALRDRITGITGTAVASRDGLIIREDTGGVNPDNLAALTSAALSLAQRLAREAGQGTLREAVTRSSGGYVAIYAIGTSAVLVLLGDEGLDVTRLHRESRSVVENLEKLLA
jgi:predicted regulator of Ras-like GTPase activity (Roadblock/LC7/MglB family)